VIAGLSNDIRFAFRSLSRSPGFAIATVLLLAIGIGGSTLVYSAVDAILVRELPVSRPGELARIVILFRNRPPEADPESIDVYEQWRSRSKSFASTFAQSDVDATLSDGSFSRPVHVEIVTGDYFAILDTTPVLGRTLTKEDEWATQGELPVVLNYDFWRMQFNGDPRVLGRVLRLEEQPFVVVGVTRKEFNGVSVDTAPDLRVPFIAGQFLTESGRRKKDPRKCCVWQIAGRLRPGVTLGQAQGETMASLESAWEATLAFERPLTEEDRRSFFLYRRRVDRVNRGVSWLRDRFAGGLLALMGAVVLLLLLACTNVAGLLLARGAAREPETALRLALGATRGHAIRYCLVESALLSAIGGACGLVIARVFIPLLSHLTPPGRNIAAEQVQVTLHPAFDFRVFGFAMLLCFIAALLTGLSPAWHASRTDFMSSLKSGTADPKRARLRAVLVGVQVALCTVVLANAGLMVETLRRMDGMNPGFDRERVVTFSLDTKHQTFSEEEKRWRHSLALRLLQETRNLPGVASAAIAGRGLMRGAGLGNRIGLPGTRVSAAELLNTSSNVVTPGYSKPWGCASWQAELSRNGTQRPPPALSSLIRVS
jgi:predicted permease